MAGAAQKAVITWPLIILILVSVSCSALAQISLKHGMRWPRFVYMLGYPVDNLWTQTRADFFAPTLQVASNPLAHDCGQCALREAGTEMSVNVGMANVRSDDLSGSQRHDDLAIGAHRVECFIDCHPDLIKGEWVGEPATRSIRHAAGCEGGVRANFAHQPSNDQDHGGGLSAERGLKGLVEHPLCTE